MKNGPNPPGAAAFVNWWISPEVQSYRAETYGQTVMNRQVKLSEAAAAKLPDKEKLAKLVEVDYATVLANRQPWMDRLQREVQK
jgi:putative spermidine/putrescine transport system substrate-binding protein